MGKTKVQTPTRDEWDALVRTSPQGSLFSSIKWMEMIGVPYNIYGVYRGEELLGGFSGFSEPAPLTPYQGILLKPEEKYTTYMALYEEVTDALMPYLPNEFYNHYQFVDIRPFKWSMKWKFDVRYSYLVPTFNPEVTILNMEKQTRYEIKNSEHKVNCVNDIDTFCDLYHTTFERKQLSPTASDELIENLYKTIDSSLYLTEDKSVGVIMMRDHNMSYYILGASNGEDMSASTIWHAILQESFYSKWVDLVGCNDYNIAKYKKGFGGMLMSYYGLRRTNEVQILR